MAVFVPKKNVTKRRVRGKRTIKEHTKGKKGVSPVRSVEGGAAKYKLKSRKRRDPWNAWGAGLCREGRRVR